MAGPQAPEPSNETPEGGPVKSFLEHLEDLRWVLVKSIVALGLGMLVCLIAANHVVEIIKWPLSHAQLAWPGTNQVVSVSFGSNHLANFTLAPAEEKSLNLGTNRFVAVQVEPMLVGTNHLLGWRVSDDPQA